MSELRRELEIPFKQKKMGIAGDDSWGARTHEEYLLDAGEFMEFSFIFKGICIAHFSIY